MAPKRTYYEQYSVLIPVTTCILIKFDGRVADFDESVASELRSEVGHALDVAMRRGSIELRRASRLKESWAELETGATRHQAAYAECESASCR